MKIKGILGAFIGSILFSLPWVLVYVYGGYMLSLLAFIIGTGALLFYKLFGGKVDKKTPTIILIISLLSVTIATFVIIPFFLLLKEGYGFDLEMFKTLYTINNFVSGIIKDYFISIVFTLLGISGILKSINNEVYGVSDDADDILAKTFDDQIECLRDVFNKYDAKCKKNAIPKSVLLTSLKYKNNISFVNEMEKRGIVVNNFNKCYLDEDAIENPKKGKKNYTKKTIKIVIFTVLATLLVMFLLILIIPSDVELKDYKYKDITITLPEDLKKHDESESYDYYNNSEMSVLLQEFELKDNIRLDDFLQYYKEEHSEKYEISKEVETLYDDLKGYKFEMVDKNSKEYHDVVYIQYDNGTVYLIVFEMYIPSNDTSSFINKTDEYMKSVKYQKS